MEHRPAGSLVGERAPRLSEATCGPLAGLITHPFKVADARTNSAKEMAMNEGNERTDRTEFDLDIEGLVVRQVNEMVRAAADVMAKGSGDSVFAMEALLYRALAVNCEAKEKMARAFAERRATTPELASEAGGDGEP
jgi:hypothetical protein